MPIKVPEYQSANVAAPRTPNVQANPNAPIEAFGGGAPVANTVAAAQGLEKTVTDLVTQEKKEADDTVSMQQYNSLLKKKNSLLYDPDAGAMNRKGQGALGIGDEYGTQFSKYADELEGNLSNDDQRRMFQQMRQRVGLDLNDTLQRHTFDQSEKLKVETAQSTIQSVTDDAVLNYFQPGKIDESIAMVKDVAGTMAKHQGLAPEGAAQAQKQAVSKVYAGIVNHMAATGNDMQAKAYFDSVKSEMHASDVLPLEKTLKLSSERGEAQKTADQITDQHATMSSALGAIRDLNLDPEVREKTHALVKQHFDDQRAAKEDQERNNFDAASAILEQSKGRAPIPSYLLANMPSAKQRAIEERRIQLQSGVEVAPNGQDFYDLMRIARDNPSQFQKINLREYMGKITSSEMSGMIRSQTSVKAGEVDDQLDGFRTNSQIVAQTTKAMSIDKNPEEVKAYEDELDRQVRIQAREKGRKLNNEEVQSISDTLATNVYQKGAGWFGFDGKVPLYKADPTKAVSVDAIDQVPKIEIQKIKDAFRRRGLTYTDDAALMLFNQKLGAIRGK